MAEFVSDCESAELKQLQIGSDAGSGTVDDANGFDEVLDEPNDDDERIRTSRSRSRSSAGSRGSP